MVIEIITEITVSSRLGVFVWAVQTTLIETIRSIAANPFILRFKNAMETKDQMKIFRLGFCFIRAQLTMIDRRGVQINVS